MARRTFPIDVRTSWLDFSPALHWHARRTAHAVLAPFGSSIRSVTIRITDPDAADLESRMCETQVVLASGGFAWASATGSELYAIVNQAIRRVRAHLQQVERGAAADGISRIT